jgi:hypothetical protein
MATRRKLQAPKRNLKRAVVASRRKKSTRKARAVAKRRVPGKSKRRGAR